MAMWQVARSESLLAWTFDNPCETRQHTLMAVICSGVGPFLTVGSGTASMSSSCGRPSASAKPSPGSKVLSASRPSGCDSNSRCASSCSCRASQETALAHRPCVP